MLTMQTAKDSNYKSAREISLLKTLEERRIATLVVEAASNCNLKCTFCDAHSGRAPKFKEHAGLMRPETWATLLDQIVEYVSERGPLEMLQFHGNGEPLLNKKLGSMIASAKKLDVAKKLRVITNGILLTPDKLNEYADAGLDEIHISLDTIHTERYEAIKKGNFADRVVENILNIIPIIEHRRDIHLFIKYFTKETSNSYGLSEEDSDIVKDKFVSFAINSDFVHLKEMPLVDVGLGAIQNKENFFSPCEIPFYLLYVMHSGKVSACCSDVFNGMTVGRILPQTDSVNSTLKSSSLLQIVDSRARYEIRKKHIDGRCNEIKLCAGCGNRSQVDVSEFPAETIEAINRWMLPTEQSA